MTVENENLITFWKKLLLMPEVKDTTFFFEFDGYGYKSEYFNEQHLKPVITPNIITIRPSNAIVWFNYNVAEINNIYPGPQTLAEKIQWHNGVWNNGENDLSQVPSKEKQLGIERSEISEMNDRIKDSRRITIAHILNDCLRRSGSISVQYSDYELDSWTEFEKLTYTRIARILNDGSVRKIRLEIEI
jgi:hypothetical protein